MAIGDNIHLKPKEKRDIVNNKTRHFDFELVDDFFKNENTIHSWKCKCGEKIERKWNKMKRHSYVKCEECKTKDVEDRYKHNIEKNGEYEYIRSYKKGTVLPNGKIATVPYVETKHKYCQKIRISSAGNFINSGDRCRRCCGSYEKSFAYHIEVELGLKLEDVWDFKKNTVDPKTISKSSNKKYWILCHEGIHDSYEVNCNNFTHNNRCPICYSSEGEKRILSWLDKNNITYIYDKPYFEDLLSDLGNPLRPDFILPEHKIWIEYDGILHYEDKFKDVDAFNKVKKHDEIKKIYAKKNNWELIRIPYFKIEDISKILDERIRGRLWT